MTAEPLVGVAVLVTESHREVQRSNIMIETGTPQLGISPHPASLADGKRRQVGVGSAQAPAMSDCDREHTRYVAGECDLTGIGRMDRGTDGNADIYAPMPSVGADWLEAAQGRPGDRRGETRTGTAGNQQGGAHTDTDQKRSDADPSPSPTALVRLWETAGRWKRPVVAVPLGGAGLAEAGSCQLHCERSQLVVAEWFDEGSICPQSLRLAMGILEAGQNENLSVGGLG